MGRERNCSQFQQVNKRDAYWNECKLRQCKEYEGRGVGGLFMSHDTSLGVESVGG